MNLFRALLSTAAILASALAVPSDARAAQTDLVATPWTELHGARVRLLAGRTKAANGHHLAGLEIGLAEGWKTYWRMPGDSGVPPSFDWAGSDNVAAAKPLYPAPVRMPEAGGSAIGYRGAALLPIEITPNDATKPITLKLSLELGLCRDICIPASANFELAIPPGAVGPPPSAIAAALDRVPRPHQSRRKTDPELKRVSVVSAGTASKLVIEAAFPAGATDADIFVEAPEGFYVPLPKRVAADGNGTLIFESELASDLAQDLKGKLLTITLVSPVGASDAHWSMP